MKHNLLQSLYLAGALMAGLVSTQAQFSVGVDHWAHPGKWTINVLPFNGAGFYMSSPDYIALDGPVFVEHPAFANMRISLGVTIPYDGTLRFSYTGVIWDGRGWGDGAGTLYESVGYSINGVDHRLSPDDGSFDGVFSDDFAFGGEQYAVPVEAGDVFAFYLTSLDSLGETYNEFGIDKSGGAHLYVQNISLAAVPEPGEWMALAGVGLIGFAGVRRWQKHRPVSG